VVLEAVLRRQHAGDPALGVGAVRLADLVFGDDKDFEVARDFERGAQASDAAADDEDVGELMRDALRVEGNEVAVHYENRLWLSPFEAPNRKRLRMGPISSQGPC